MKKLIKAIFCTAVTVIIFFGVRYAMDAYIQKNNEPEIFETGSYTDYYYTALNETQKQAYTAIREQVYDFPKSIKVPELDNASLDKVLEALIYDDPYMFMFDSCSLVTIGSSHYFEPKYNMTAEEYTKAKSLCEKKINAVLSSLPETDSYGKQLYLHDWVIDLCTYSDTGEIHEGDMSSVFTDGLAKCSGYAKAYKALLDRMEIPCVLISGIATDYDENSSNHMWVATETDGIWSYTDITWNDPVTESGDAVCRHIYFCMSENMLRRTHSDFSFSAPCPDDTGLYYYQRKNIYYYDYNIDTVNSLAAVVAAQTDSNSTQAEFMFADKTAFDKAVDALFEKGEIYEVLLRANKKSNTEIKMKSVQYRNDTDTNLITILFEIKD